MTDVSIWHLLVLVTVAGCANMLPLAHNSGAVLSEDGVVLAVTGQNCRQAPDANQPGKTLMDAIFAIEVGTSTAEPVAVRPGKFQLAVADHTLTPIAAGEADTTLVENGTTVRFLLHFVVPGANCTQEMRLLSAPALELRGAPITLEAVRFVPS